MGRLTRVLTLAVLAACANGLQACGIPTIKLPAAVGRGVAVGDHFYAVSTTGRLFDVDMRTWRVRELGPTDGKLLPFVDVAGGKACVAAPGRVQVIDLGSGKVLRTQSFRGEVRGLGFAAGGRCFVCTGATVLLLDGEWGVTRTVDLGRKGEARGLRASRAVGSCQRVGDRLYVAGGRGGVAVVDLKKGKLLEQLLSGDESFGVQVCGNRAFVLGQTSDTGISSNRFRCVDLTTGKSTALPLPPTVSGDVEPCSLFSTPDGTLLLAGQGRAFRYDGTGKLLGPLAGMGAGSVVGVWNRHALVCRGATLRLVWLPRAAAKAH
jgi:hypothetical protein